MVPTPSDAPHLPRSAPIDAYGNGGFAFADMSHRGSLLCLPDAIWAWPVTKAAEIDEYTLSRVFAAANGIDSLIIGTGTDVWIAPNRLRAGVSRGSCRPRHYADRTGHPHLQRHDWRAAARGCGADCRAMSASEEDKAAAGHCAELVRTHDFTRYASALFVPAPERRALLALYAFNAEICRVHAQVKSAASGRDTFAMVARHACRQRPWRRRGKSGCCRTASGRPQLSIAGGAAVAPDRGAW